MTYFRFLVCALAFISILGEITSCQIAYPIQGMIYDQDSCPVTGYRITLDSHKTATTDINGRFTFPETKYGTHTVQGSDERYLPVRAEYPFAARTDILHIKLTSIESLYCEPDEEIESCKFESAKRTAESLQETEHGTKRFKLYTAILLFRTTGNFPYWNYLRLHAMNETGHKHLLHI